MAHTDDLDTSRCIRWVNLNEIKKIRKNRNTKLFRNKSKKKSGRNLINSRRNLEKFKKISTNFRNSPKKSQKSKHNPRNPKTQHAEILT